MREAMTSGAGLALIGGILLVALAPAAMSSSGGAASQASADPVRWTLSLSGTVSSSRESTTRTVSPPGCTTELTQTSSEVWRWSTREPLAVDVRRGSRGQPEIVRGSRHGAIRVPVIASMTATAAESSTTTGTSPDCKPSYGLSGVCPDSRSGPELFVSVEWNARSARLEFGPPAPTPAALRRRVGGCAKAGDPASLFELAG